MKQQHILYVASDFKNEYESHLADMVINGGLGVCKICNKGEIQLSEPCHRILIESEFNYKSQYDMAFALAELLAERKTESEIRQQMKDEKFKNAITNTALLIKIKELKNAN